MALISSNLRHLRNARKLSQQELADMHADKSGGAGNKNFHKTTSNESW